MERIICLDIDGTLADSSMRRELSRINAQYFWCAELIVQDILMEYSGGPDWSALLVALRRWVESQGRVVLYLSGREERFREVTRSWLEQHDFPRGPLVLRPDEDRRSDACFKRAVLEGVAGIVLAVDDCGAAYQDSAPLWQVYQEAGILVLSPEEAFGEADGLRKWMAAQ